jgi:hypothetical protein
MIKIADYCDRLHRLNHQHDDEASNDEFDLVCTKIFGFMLDDTSDDEEDLLGGQMYFADANSIAMRFGFDMRMTKEVPVMDWEHFWFMIKVWRWRQGAAWKRESSLEVEAVEFIRKRAAGVVSGRR